MWAPPALECLPCVLRPRTVLATCMQIRILDGQAVAASRELFNQAGAGGEKLGPTTITITVMLLPLVDQDDRVR